jgi:hypothetical protein
MTKPETCDCASTGPDAINTCQRVIRGRVEPPCDCECHKPKTEPAEWLKELGAIRPMAPVVDLVLVLGKWHKGFYPIEFELGKSSVRKGVITSTPDKWRLFGRLIEGQLTRDEVERILEQLK